MPPEDNDGKNDEGGKRLDVVGEIDVGGDADWMGVGFGSLWVPVEGTLLRIDPQAMAIVARIPIGGAPYRGVAIGGDAVYVPSTADDAIAKIDPATNAVAATFSVPLHGDSEGSIGVSDGALWVVTDLGGDDHDGQLSRLDAASGTVTATVAVPADAHGVVADDRSVWVTSLRGNSVAQIDLASAQPVRTIPVDAGPRFVTAGEGAVWVLSQGTGTVTRIDASYGEVAVVIDVHAPGHGGDIAYGEGAVWVTTFGKPVGKIAPDTNRLVEQFVQDGFGDAIRAGLGKIWVSGEKIFAIAVP